MICWLENKILLTVKPVFYDNPRSGQELKIMAVVDS